MPSKKEIIYCCELIGKLAANYLLIHLKYPSYDRVYMSSVTEKNYKMVLFQKPIITPPPLP